MLHERHRDRSDRASDRSRSEILRPCAGEVEKGKDHEKLLARAHLEVGCKSDLIGVMQKRQKDHETDLCLWTLHTRIEGDKK